MPLLSLENFLEFENTIGYKFKKPYLLIQALTHRSYANEKFSISNERLEFLGDIVLGFIISDYLYNLQPELNEAEMSKIRAFLVSKRFLAFLSRKLFIGKFILLGKGERNSGGENKDSILADALEALIGAIYLDGGLCAVKDFLLRIISEISVSELFPPQEEQDFLLNLQNMLSP